MREIDSLPAIIQAMAVLTKKQLMLTVAIRFMHAQQDHELYNIYLKNTEP